MITQTGLALGLRGIGGHDAQFTPVLTDGMELNTILQIGANSQDIALESLTTALGEGEVVGAGTLRGSGRVDDDKADIGGNGLVQVTVEGGERLLVVGVIPEEDGAVDREKDVNTRVHVTYLRA